jgi:hypothetical protein
MDFIINYQLPEGDSNVYVVVHMSLMTSQLHGNKRVLFEVLFLSLIDNFFIFSNQFPVTKWTEKIWSQVQSETCLLNYGVQ